MIQVFNIFGNLLFVALAIILIAAICKLITGRY